MRQNCSVTTLPKMHLTEITYDKEQGLRKSPRVSKDMLPRRGRGIGAGVATNMLPRWGRGMV